MKRGDPGKSDYIAHVIAHIIIKIDELEGPKLMNATKADIDKHRNTIFGQQNRMKNQLKDMRKEVEAL